MNRAPTKPLKEELVEHFKLNIELNVRKQWENAICEADSYLENKRKILMMNNNRQQMLSNNFCAKRKVNLIRTTKIHYKI